MIDVYHFCMAMYHKDCEIRLQLHDDLETPEGARAMIYDVIKGDQKFDTYKYREYSVVMF